MWGLSMNLKTLGLISKDLQISGSRSQCVRKSERGLSMNRRVLPASCRRKNRRNALPTRRRQHLVGVTVGAFPGSWSQYMRGSEWGLSMNRTNSELTLPSKAAEDRRTPERWRLGHSRSGCSWASNQLRQSRFTRPKRRKFCHVQGLSRTVSYFTVPTPNCFSYEPQGFHLFKRGCDGRGLASCLFVFGQCV